MDPSSFGNNSPGRLVPIDSGHAFVPRRLPPENFSMDDGLWRALAEAKSRLMLLEGSCRRLVSPGMFLRPLQRREAVQSSTIEHIFATQEELLLFEIESGTSSPREASDGLREVLNYERAMARGVELLHDIPISLRFIRELHKTLLIGVRGSNKDPGRFRRVQVSIGTRFVPPPPNELDECLSALELYAHASSDIDPLIRAFWMHYQFESIHPFRDGNGRVGRLLLALSIAHLCDLTQPWLYMSAYFERHQSVYMDLLYRISTEGAWREWTLFCLSGVIEQANDTIRRTSSLLELRERYQELLAHGGKSASIRVLQTLDELFETPILTIPLVQDRRGIDYKTAKKDVARLESEGILETVPGRHPRTLIAQEILRLASDEKV